MDVEIIPCNRGEALALFHVNDTAGQGLFVIGDDVIGDPGHVVGAQSRAARGGGKPGIRRAVSDVVRLIFIGRGVCVQADSRSCGEGFLRRP